MNNKNNPPRPTIINLDHRKSSHTKDEAELDAWRKQSADNENHISVKLTEKGFSDDCIEFARDHYNAKTICIGEHVFMGCNQFIAVIWDSNDCISVNVYIKTPQAFYSGQGLGSIYRSVQDVRVEELQKDFQNILERFSADNDPKTAFEKTRGYIDDQMNSLLHKIWKEQIDNLYQTVGCDEFPTYW